MPSFEIQKHSDPCISIQKQKKRFSRLQRSLTVSSDNMVLNEVKSKFNSIKHTLKFAPVEPVAPVQSIPTSPKSNRKRKLTGGGDGTSLRTRIHNVARTSSERAVSRLKRSKGRPFGDA